MNNLDTKALARLKQMEAEVAKSSVKVKDLKAALNQLPPEVDDLPVCIWLPGSRLYIGLPFFHDKANAVMIEGNVAEGSILDDLMEENR